VSRTGSGWRLRWRAAALGVLLALPAAAGQAEEGDGSPGLGGWLHELRAGVAAHDVDGLWSGDREESGADWSAEITLLRTGLVLPVGAVRPNLGAALNDHGDTSKVYAGALWEIESRIGLFVATGVGAAVHDGYLDERKRDRKRLGSRVLFRIPLEIGYAFGAHHRLIFAFDHVSNASLADPNEGLDTVGVRYGYRF
jgi:hypothetical protein